jgi:hypothetical protein
MDKLTKNLVVSLARKEFKLPKKTYINLLRTGDDTFKLWYENKLGGTNTYLFTSADLL